jgi:signal transduction histidine kinase
MAHLVKKRVTTAAPWGWTQRYGFAVVLVVLATGISLLARPVTDASDSPLFVAAVMLAAWLGGLGPSLLATALAVVPLDAVMTRGHVSFVLNAHMFARLTLFVLVALFVSAVDAARRRAASERESALTGERIARADAEAASRAKDEFVTVVAHELRTPMTAILGWTAAIEKARYSEATTARGIEVIRRNALLQARVIDDLIDLSRVAHGKISLRMTPVDLHAVIEASIEAVADAAVHRAIKVTTDVPVACRQVRGDAVRLQQVVSNLLVNAIKHSEGGTSISVALTVEAGSARIEVRDEGDGIAPELLPYVFERYRQAAGPMARSGLGLGLAIVRELVVLHGGHIQAASPGVGQGATFTVVLPLGPQDTAAAGTDEHAGFVASPLGS